jgi:sRNA-binding protein
MNTVVNSKRAMVAVVLELRAERFPKAFAVYQNRRKPLKDGIRHEIASRARRRGHAGFDRAAVLREQRELLARPAPWSRPHPP